MRTLKESGLILVKQGVTTPENDETPNAETLEAFEELDNGGGHTYNGPVENLIDSLLGDESA